LISGFLHNVPRKIRFLKHFELSKSVQYFWSYEALSRRLNNLTQTVVILHWMYCKRPGSSESKPMLSSLDWHIKTPRILGILLTMLHWMYCNRPAPSESKTMLSSLYWNLKTEDFYELYWKVILLWMYCKGLDHLNQKQCVKLGLKSQDTTNSWSDIYIDCTLSDLKWPKSAEPKTILTSQNTTNSWKYAD